MKIKKGDFIEVEYTGKLKEDNFVFDTTSEKTAKDKNIFNPYAQYGPTVVCIGKHQLIKGLDEDLEGKETGKEYTFELTPEKGFGKKSAQLLKLISMSAFKKGNTKPEPGMQVDVGGQIGTVKTVTGGRVTVDFNHPLAGKDLVYTVKVNKIVTDDSEKIKAMLSLTLNLKKDKIDVGVKDKKATVKMMKIPEQYQPEMKKLVMDAVPTVKEVIFEEKKQENSSTDSRKNQKEEKQPLNTSKE